MASDRNKENGGKLVGGFTAGEVALDRPTCRSFTHIFVATYRKVLSLAVAGTLYVTIV